MASTEAGPPPEPEDADQPRPRNDPLATGPWPRSDEPAPGLWSRTDALVTGGACVMNLLSYVFFDAPGDAPGTAHRVNAVGFLLVALGALPLLARRRHPVAAFAAVLVLDATAAVAVPLPHHFGAVLVVALYTVARARPGWPTAWTAVAIVAATLGSQNGGRLPRLPEWQQVVSPPLTVLLVVGTALVVNRWQREVAANRRLLADRAVAEERRRIARELHDIVAHHLTTMQLMAGGARANLARPEVARDALITLESSGRLALNEMRQLLDVLRADDEPGPGPGPGPDPGPESAPRSTPPLPQPGVADIAGLVDASRAAGLATDFTTDGPPRPLPPTVALTLFRVVQEALTNTRKHAGASRATVRLTYRRDAVVVEVRDDGAGETTRGGAPGYGLVGMRERVALHGGSLSAGPRSTEGFGVLVQLPYTTDELTTSQQEPHS
ncbi:sensor histidine kinase [Streptomyces sp. NPDC087440]|uniref:sensor histidine kinase n=1 Tax=Streptomyces sp. NPDC087440 TaxID=3365790 RepID=UPI0037FBE935